MSIQDFKITLPIERVYRDANGNLCIEGIASSTTLDTYETIFNENCQEGFEMDVNNGADTEEPVQIEAEHKGNEEPMNILGVLTRATVTPDNMLHITGILDEANPKAVYYYNILTRNDPKLGRPKRLGLSINGSVQEAHWEFSKELGKTIRVFDRVKLDKVGIVRSPSNPDTWVEKLVRSVDWDAIETKEKLMSEEKIAANTESTEEVAATVDNAEQVETRQEEVVEPTEEVVSNNGASETEEAPAEAATEEVNRVEEPTETTEEKVERVDAYQGVTLLQAMGSLMQAMANAEQFAYGEKWEQEFDNEDPDAGRNLEAARAALKMMSSALPFLQAAFANEVAPDAEIVPDSTERALDTSNSTALQKEDISDDVTDVTAELEATDNKRSNEEAPESENLVVRANVELSTEQVESLLERVSSVVTEAVDNVKRELTESFNIKVDEVTRELETVKSEKEELIERIAKMEKKPASVPGMQLINESVTRSEDNIDAQIKRAVENNDPQTWIKLKLLRDWNVK